MSTYRDDEHRGLSLSSGKSETFVMIVSPAFDSVSPRGCGDGTSWDGWLHPCDVKRVGVALHHGKVVAFVTQVHGGHTVVVRPVAAVAAAECVRFLVAVLAGHVSASGACLARVRWVHCYRGLPVAGGLVFDERAELAERPRDLHVTLLDFHGFRRIADACEVFEREERVLAVLVDECLRDLMVDVGHPTVFSTAYGFETFSRAARAPVLQLFAEFLVFAAPVFHLLPIVENGALPVVGGSKEPDTQVDADDGLRMFRGIRRWDGDGDEQMPFVPLADEACGSEPPMPVLVGNAGPFGFHFDAPIHDGEAEQACLGGVRVVPVPQQVGTVRRILGFDTVICWDFPPLAPLPVLLTFALLAEVSDSRVDGLVVGDDPAYRRLGHLREQPMGFAQLVVDGLVDFLLAERVRGVHVVSHVVAAVGERRTQRCESVRLPPCGR